MAEYDGTIHRGWTAERLKELHKDEQGFTGRPELLKELSQPPEGWCETCGGKGYSLDWETKDAKGETWHYLTEQDAKKIPCPDCTNVPG